ncbi:MAG TPA: phosphohydrolase [Patescibacteria group bacterium]
MTVSYINQDIYPLEFGMHRKYAPAPLLLDLVWTHCNIVCDVALQLFDRDSFDKSGLERALVVQACLLHDLGVYLCGGFEWIPDITPRGCLYAHHTLIGAWILQQEQFHPLVVQGSYAHAGVGLTTEDIRQFGLQLPEADYRPQNKMATFIAYVSKFHSKAPHFKNNQQVKEALAKYGEQKVRTFEEWELQFGMPDLAPLEEKYKEWHERMASQIDQLNTQQVNQVNLSSAGVSH